MNDHIENIINLSEFPRSNAAAAWRSYGGRTHIHG